MATDFTLSPEQTRSEACLQMAYGVMRLVRIDSHNDRHPLARLMRDAPCFWLDDAAPVAPHCMMRRRNYDPLAAAAGKESIPGL